LPKKAALALSKISLSTLTEGLHFRAVDIKGWLKAKHDDVTLFIDDTNEFVHSVNKSKLTEPPENS
jgi:hypothetical protein